MSAVDELFDLLSFVRSLESEAEKVCWDWDAPEKLREEAAAEAACYGHVVEAIEQAFRNLTIDHDRGRPREGTVVPAKRKKVRRGAAKLVLVKG